MDPKKIGAGILGTTALVFGGVDASKLDEQPIERTETVAGYTVEAKQIENRVETSFPWKDQPAIKVVYDMGEPTLAEKFNDKRNKEVVTEVVDFGDGGFKVDILLDEKPDTNQFCYAIQGAENYDFFYQPPLTEQDIAEGASRPPDIDGSYAVYHKTLKNHEIGKENYATGKVMHIPRPQVWSMSDTETKVWADMNYDNGNLCVTVPQDFLDKAEYPVRVDPTFGYTSIGVSTFAFGGNSVRANGPYLVTQNGDITSVSLYHTGGCVAGETYRGVIYASSTYALVGSTGGEVTCPGNDWSTSTVSASVVASSDYFVSVWFATTSWNGRADDGTAYNLTRDDLIYSSTGNSADPFVEVSRTNGRRLSVYATYTATGGGGGSPTPNQNIILFE